MAISVRPFSGKLSKALNSSSLYFRTLSDLSCQVFLALLAYFVGQSLKYLVLFWKTCILPEQFADNLTVHCPPWASQSLTCQWWRQDSACLPATVNTLDFGKICVFCKEIHWILPSGLICKIKLCSNVGVKITFRSRMQDETRNIFQKILQDLNF